MERGPQKTKKEKPVISDIELSGKTTWKQEVQPKKRSVKKRKSYFRWCQRRKLWNHPGGSICFKLFISSNTQTKWRFKCSKLIMEGFYADGEVSLSSHTSSPFRSMACLNHRASWQTSIHHHLPVYLEVPFSLLWISTHQQADAYYICAERPLLQSAFQRNILLCENGKSSSFAL